MSWRRWKIGLLAALTSTFIDGIILYFADPEVAAHFRDHIGSISIGLFVILAKAFGMYIKQHPIEEITDGTTIITKEEAGK